MAGSLNKVMIIGRMGKDPETRYTQTGQAVCNITVATDEGYVKDGQKVERTEWHQIVLWGKQAEFCQNYLGKGRLVFVEGSLQTRSWEDQQGNKRYRTEIKAFRIAPLDPKPQSSGYAPAPQTESSAQSDTMPVEDNGPIFPSEVSDMDDTPF